MAKVMLIMDEMPTTCSECNLCGFDGVCHAVHEFCQYRFDKKQEWCPLREVPQKKKEEHRILKPYEDTPWHKRFVTEKDVEAIGYNDCIDEILGGGE